MRIDGFQESTSKIYLNYQINSIAISSKPSSLFEILN